LVTDKASLMLAFFLMPYAEIGLPAGTHLLVTLEQPYPFSILKVKQTVGRALPDILIRRAKPALQKCTLDLELELHPNSSKPEVKFLVPGRV
jgi:hypothetical protein